jgi:hypothetical protein
VAERVSRGQSIWGYDVSKGNGGKGNGGQLDTASNEKSLSTKDLYLIELLADPEDTRSKEDKAIEAGYSAKHVYKLEKRPQFATVLEQKISENFERLKQGRGQVLQALRDRALGTDTADADANKAAELFLKVTGDIATGQNIQLTQVQANGEKVRQSRKGRLREHLAEIISE